MGLLKRYEPSVVPGVDPSVHYLAPHVPKATWTAIGDAVSACEKNSYGSVDGSRWISLRLDGSGFSKAVRAMRSKGVLEQGFSETFASCMQDCVKLLMEHFHARIGYTQSDEMIVFIPPANVVRGEQQPHLHAPCCRGIQSYITDVCQDSAWCHRALGWASLGVGSQGPAVPDRGYLGREVRRLPLYRRIHLPSGAQGLHTPPMHCFRFCSCTARGVECQKK